MFRFWFFFSQIFSSKISSSSENDLLFLFPFFMVTRANNRYYYRNKATNRIQWDYPEAESKEKPEEKAAAASEEGDVICTKVESAVAPEEARRPRSRPSSRHRKRDEKDRSMFVSCCLAWFTLSVY